MLRSKKIGSVGLGFGIVDVALDSLGIQITGPEDRVESLIKLLENFGIKEMVRTGRVAMVRGNGHSNGNGHNNGNGSAG